MRLGRVGMWVAVAMIAGASAGWSQTSAPAPATVAGSTSASTATAKKRAARRNKVQPQAGARVQVIPMETAPPSPPTSPAMEAAQRAADQKLLAQQERQSAAEARITDQQVQRAQEQQENMDKEARTRIQDAPGPAQTGVVPAAGPPVAPVNADERIQDAPGPAQTLPPLPQAAPSQPPPANPPQS